MSTPLQTTRTCPDGGACHHTCAAACLRVLACAPLSGTYPDERWPEATVRLHQEAEGARQRLEEEAAQRGARALRAAGLPTASYWLDATVEVRVYLEAEPTDPEADAEEIALDLQGVLDDHRTAAWSLSVQGVDVDATVRSAPVPISADMVEELEAAQAARDAGDAGEAAR